MPDMTRRVALAGAASLLACPALALPGLHLGVLPLGSVQWIADVILRHGLDTARGFSLRTSKLAGSDASRVALLGQSVDVAVSDWPFVAAQRARGTNLCFAPLSSALGGVTVPSDSKITRLADLRGLRLGVAGGPEDKSWLIVQAAGRHAGIDLARQAVLSYGAPPLLGGLLEKGALDAVLTFWTNAARLEAAGFHEAISVADCARALGLPDAPVLVGYVFSQAWAEQHRAVLDGFLDAAAAACEILRKDEAEWRIVRKLMDAPDDAVFENLRRRFVAGIARPSASEQARTAQLVLRAIAGPAEPASLPPGVFWPGAQAG